MSINEVGEVVNSISYETISFNSQGNQASNKKLFEIIKPKKQKFQNRWSQEEDIALCDYIKLYGTNYSSCMIKSVLPGRTVKSIKERWENILSPGLSKKPWELDDDFLLFKLFYTFGKHWVQYKKYYHFKKSENSIKNRFYSILRKLENKIKKAKLENYPINEDDMIKIIYNDLQSKIKRKYSLNNKENLTQDQTINDSTTLSISNNNDYSNIIHQISQLEDFIKITKEEINNTFSFLNKKSYINKKNTEYNDIEYFDQEHNLSAKNEMSLFHSLD